MTCPIYMLAPLSKAQVAGISPRLRGKDKNHENSEYQNRGSPPLARERRRRRAGSLLIHRITPACAGKTLL